MKFMHKPKKVISSFIAAFLALTITLQPINKESDKSHESDIYVCGIGKEESKLPPIPFPPKIN